MRLSKIYSNSELMKPIKFNRGFNVIYGVLDKNNENSNEHNLGKTSLVNLIDFMLLKTVNKNDLFVKHKNKFSGWFFFLELELNDGSFLTIKRGVDAPNFVSFKKHFKSDQNFVELTNWDFLDTRMGVRKEKDSLTILEEILDFNVLTNYNLRHFLEYALRTQYDYEDVFEMSSFKEGLDVDWKPFLFNAVGFDDDKVLEKYKLYYQGQSYERIIKTLQHEKKKNDPFAMKAAINELEKEKAKLLDQIQKFDFYQQEKEINREVIENLESKISKLNAERYRVEHSVEKIRESLDSALVYDLNEVIKLYEEAQIAFSDQLKRSFDEVVDFNNSVSRERSKYLKKELTKLNRRTKEINSDLERLNDDRKQALSFLQDTDTFTKYKSYQRDLEKVQDKIHSFEEKMKSGEDFEGYQDKIDKLKEKSRKVAIEIENTILKQNAIYEEIQSIYTDIFKRTWNITALFYVKPNSVGNPEFIATAIKETEFESEITGEGEGYSAKKVQCAAFVIALLSVYSSQNFYKFAYHDGVFESIGDKPKEKFIKCLRDYCNKYDIQYIASMISSDLPKGFDFEDGEIVRTLNSEDLLYGFRF